MVFEGVCGVSHADSWDCGDFQGDACVEEEGEELSTTMLITGPSGVGKTASVYACALELGFKVGFREGSTLLIPSCDGPLTQHRLLPILSHTSVHPQCMVE